MIAPLRASTRPRITKTHQAQFLALLPAIRQQARIAFRSQDPELREELTQSAVALTYSMFVLLVRRGKADLAFATPLSQYAVRQVRSGRQLGAQLNRNDISSSHAQRFHNLQLERLDQADSESGDWKEALVEDRRAGPADTAIARLDFAAWLRSLPTRLRRIAKALSTGETTAEVARRFELTAGRVSQMRRELMQSWEEFQHDEAGISFCAA